MPSATVTAAAPDVQGPVVERVVPMPNPNAKALKVLIQGRADALDLELYTKAMVLVASASQPGGSAWVHAPLPGAWGTLPAGLYYVKVTARSGPRRSQAATRLMIVR
jgi:hypothetical protein